jgi:NAD kinase
MGSLAPRAVLVTRETEYEGLLARHATREQARFFLSSRGQDLATVEQRHQRFQAALRQVRAAVPGDWRSVLVRRGDLDRFLFAPDDIVLAIGQDGLIANIAKYLDGQPVLGFNPDPALYDGVLVTLAPERVGSLLTPAAHGDAAVERRTMVEARLDDGQVLRALNEIFVGHQSHQSARYLIEANGTREQQSSSGLIVASGTGATGWARSIMEATGTRLPLMPEERALAYFVREPFPSVATGTTIRAGKCSDEMSVRVTSHMNDGGVIFADGIEHDHLGFGWGRTVELRVSERRLNLVRS